MGKVEPVSQEQFEAALELLDVPPQDQDEARDDLLSLVATVHRHELIPKMKDARNDLRDLVKHLDQVSTDLQCLHRDAWFDLFYDDELAEKFGSVDENEARKGLAQLTDKAHAIFDDQYGRIKRGKPANAHKRRFVREGRKKFDKWSPTKARRKSGNFEDFLEAMYEAATGIRVLNKKAFFERALRYEFTERPGPGTRGRRD